MWGDDGDINDVNDVADENDDANDFDWKFKLSVTIFKAVL